MTDIQLQKPEFEVFKFCVPNILSRLDCCIRANNNSDPYSVAEHECFVGLKNRITKIVDAMEEQRFVRYPKCRPDIQLLLTESRHVINSHIHSMYLTKGKVKTYDKESLEWYNELQRAKLVLDYFMMNHNYKKQKVYKDGDW